MKKKYYVEGMTCSACVSHVENAVRKVPGVTDVSVNLMTKEMFVTSDAILDKKIFASVKKAGYLALDAGDAILDLDNKKLNKKKRTLLISIILSIVLMVIAMFHMFVHNLNDILVLIFTIIQLVLATLIIILNFRFYKSGFKKLVLLKPNMDSLIAIGSSVSYLYSLYGFIMIIINYIQIKN